MGLFFKKKEPVRTNDQRLENLAKIKRSYTTVGVYGEEGLSPSELERRIIDAYRDMERLIQSQKTCGEWRGDSGSCWEEDSLELWCEHCDKWLDPDWSYCPDCGAKIVEPRVF